MDLFATHRETLERALEAIARRGWWSPHPEAPSGKVYGETAKADGAAAFAAQRGQRFVLDQPTTGRWIGAERSPYGFDLGITYPEATVEQLIEAATASGERWAAAGAEARVGVCLEILARLNRISFEIANAVMHTTGQAFVMAFQAGGPHAQDRGLEAVAYAWDEMRRVPQAALWEKPQGRGEPVRIDKTFRIVPRGVAVTIACSTFPTWNGYPGVFASLATGNPVIVKPHPGAVLPLALTVRVARAVLAEAGQDPNLVLLAVDTAEAPIAKDLVSRPEVAIVDYTGGPDLGDWLQASLPGRLVYTEQAGVNPVVIESTDDYSGLCDNLAFSLSLYSGQMCTAPQNLFVPAGGAETDQGRRSADAVAADVAAAIDRLLADPARAAAVLGAIQSEATLRRVEAAAGTGTVARASAPLANPEFPAARTATPLVLRVRASDHSSYRAERFGPISYVVETESVEDAIDRAAGLAAEKGAITAAVYSTREAVLARAEAAFAGAGVALSCNFTGPVHVNQSAAFSDYHVSGANPAGTACLTDSAFVAGRFRVAMTRRPHAGGATP